MKTDNSYLQGKIELRIQSLPKKENIYVLDCYSGSGTIWKEVKKQTKLNITIVSIEQEIGKNKTALQGNNLKYLNILELSKFDIIDLDAYGIPYAQLKIIFKRKYKGIVHVTAIQSGMGQLPKGLIKEIGYTEQMMEKISSLFNRQGIEKLKNYLYINGITKINGFFINRKNYFYFNTLNLKNE